MNTIGHWIDGRVVPPGTDSLTSDVYDPARGEVIAKVTLGTRDDVDRAVASASHAAQVWAQTPLGRRAAVLFRFRELLVEHTDELAAIVSTEHGKVIADAKGEIARGLEVVEFACGAPQLLKGEHSEQAATDIDVFSVREPLGVVAGITPFNFPVMVPLWMAPVAIATGNAFILKPSERDPSASLVLADLWRQAGLPDGVFSVVQGGKKVVDALLHHPDTAAISFVGSTPVARYIHDTASAQNKRVQALGGAKNHGVVLADADLDLAAQQLVAAAYGAAGERCMALSVAVVEDRVADALVDRLERLVREIRVGRGDEPDTDMGPVINAAAKERIESIIASVEREGGRLVVDGRGVRVSGCEGGFFVGPTLVDRITVDQQVYVEEIFGPVLGVLRVKDLAEAIDVINANPYGNGTSIFTRSGEAARTFGRSVKVGMIGVNVPIPVPVAAHSFGGWRDSLFGQSHIYGPEGIAFYTRGKITTQRWPRSVVPDTASFHFSGDAQK